MRVFRYVLLTPLFLVPCMNLPERLDAGAMVQIIQNESPPKEAEPEEEKTTTAERIPPREPQNAWEKSVVEYANKETPCTGALIEEIIAERSSRLTPETVRAMSLVESMGNPRAVNRESGAKGCLGIKPIVCKDLKIKCDGLLNPRTNIDIGVRYLQKLQTDYGFEDTQEMLLAFGTGPHKGRKILEKKPAAEHRYIQRIMFALEHIDPPA